MIDALKVGDKLDQTLGKTPIKEDAGIPLSVSIPSLDWPVPMRRPFSSALYNYQTLPPRSLLNSNSATPKKPPQTPEMPVE